MNVDWAEVVVKLHGADGDVHVLYIPRLENPPLNDSFITVDTTPVLKDDGKEDWERNYRDETIREIKHLDMELTLKGNAVPQGEDDSFSYIIYKDGAI